MKNINKLMIINIIQININMLQMIKLKLSINIQDKVIKIFIIYINKKLQKRVNKLNIKLVVMKT